MPTTTLYGVAASRAFRNIWMLNELGLAYEHDPVHYTDAKLKLPPYSDMNPNARIPMLKVGEHVMFESLAINLYLARKHGGPLAPQTTEEDGHATQWALWAATELEEPILVWAINTLVKPEAERDHAAARAAVEKLQRPLAALEATLEKSAHLLGKRFTVADVNTASIMYRCLWMDLTAFPAVAAWLKHCLSRPLALEARRTRGESI